MTPAAAPDRRERPAEDARPPGAGRPQVFVLIATAGRPGLVGAQIRHLGSQTVEPDHLVVCPARVGDVSAPAAEGRMDRLVVAEPREGGLCAQRNAGLEIIFERLGARDEDVVVMIDDDFVLRSDWLEACGGVLGRSPGCAGVTGVLAEDGARGAGLSFEEGAALLASRRFVLSDGDWRRAVGEVGTLYGCNMAFRAGALRGLAFDEALPLYAWLEDADFSGQISRRGALMRADALVGVHLGVKAGRVSGRRYGYSQIANNLYLMRKGTLERSLGTRLMRDALLANLARSASPEPWIDRRGRLAGNVAALWDAARGRSHPRRVLEF